MDLISVSALIAVLSKIDNGTTEKVGKELWESLSSNVRRLFGRNSTSVEAVKRLGERPGQPDAIRALAQALVDDCGHDPHAAAQLRHWLVSAEQTITAHESATDPASVRGNVLQARDIHGNIPF